MQRGGLLLPKMILGVGNPLLGEAGLFCKKKQLWEILAPVYCATQTNTLIDLEEGNHQGPEPAASANG